MRVDFVPPELRRLDLVKTDAFALCLLRDDWPLRGTPGLVDWRVGGHLSRLRESGWITCDLGEIVLMPLSRRLASEKLLLVGMGEPEERLRDEQLRQGFELLFSSLEKLKAHATAIHLPRHPVDLDARRVMELLLDVVEEHPDHDELVVVEPADVQAVMQQVCQSRLAGSPAEHAS